MGRDASAKLTEQHKQVIQLTWHEILGFIWQRFVTYERQKIDVEQWDPVGRQLKSMAVGAEKPELFIRNVLRAIGVNEGE